MLNALVSSALALTISLPAGKPVVAPTASTGGPVGIADSIVIEKRAHRLTLFHMGRPLRSYMVALGGDPAADKVRAGDRRTPEGLFSIEARNPFSKYHLSLRISYPDVRHLRQAQALGVSPGGDIMIHGLPNNRHSVGSAHRATDWTNGCIALTDQEIEEIWSAVPVGTPVEIKA